MYKHDYLQTSFTKCEGTYYKFPSGSYELFHYESLNCCHIYFFILQNMHVLLQNVQVHIEKFVINDQL